MRRIDCHAHLLGDHPAVAEMLDELNLEVVNICVSRDTAGQWRHQVGEYIRITESYPGRYGWCTAFDMPTFDDARYAERVIEGLDRDFAAGAVACKVWKNIGMELKDPAGRFVMPDDPVFQPIFAHLARIGRPLVMHVAEPLACWQPLEPDNPHYGYYSRWPKWHMFGRPEYPGHADIIDARDRLMERHPALTVIGAHLASLEYDVREIARRMDRYPNFVADTSARILDLSLQNRQRVRQFFIDYADRLLFGTDIVSRKSFAGMADDERVQAIAALRERYLAEQAFFETDRIVVIRGREVRGLDLPPEVAEKLFTTNSRRWIPGLP